ncbi:MAG TPA: Mov34/MPN/PAD-1 family protein [Gemmata sp.]|nr:Mov34/MPN/PAD-1 family protein [Gemmata sp.]
MPRFKRLSISAPLLEGMISHARGELPNECCGVLAGFISENVGYAIERATIRNDLASPTRYLTNAADLFAAFRAMRANSTELLAVYHSHPSSPPVPSRRDVQENTYGDSVVHLILGLAGEEPDLKAWWITETGWREAELEVSQV